MHRKPVAFVPFIIRWGPDASTDMLRRSARCTKCGRKGAALQHPSWAGMDVGFEPFPVARAPVDAPSDSVVVPQFEFPGTNSICTSAKSTGVTRPNA